MGAKNKRYEKLLESLRTSYLNCCNLKSCRCEYLYKAGEDLETDVKKN